MNKKGFTLIEILAVLIIMGVILIIAVPSISRYIMQSKTSTYITDAKRFVEAGRNLVETGQLKLISKDTTYYIPRECLPVEKGQESPFGAWQALYVVVTYDGDEHNYYFTATDSTKHGIKLVYSDNLSDDKVEFNIARVDTSIAVGPRGTIKVLNPNSCTTAGAAGVRPTIHHTEKE
jgi:prepilin-type N-terminal cleavage/methylation domain-containing protein